MNINGTGNNSGRNDAMDKSMPIEILSDFREVPDSFSCFGTFLWNQCSYEYCIWRNLCKYPPVA